MREILFRGKTIGVNRWICGQWLPKSAKIVFEQEYGGQVELTEFFVNSETVGQYTGLTDKNGTKIFEGDIVRNDWCFLRGYSVIKFGQYKPLDMSNDYQQGHLGFYLEHIHKVDKNTARKDIMYFANKCEVIGNIHDNKLEDFENGC